MQPASVLLFCPTQLHRKHCLPKLPCLHLRVLSVRTRRVVPSTGAMGGGHLIASLNLWLARGTLSWQYLLHAYYKCCKNVTLASMNLEEILPFLRPSATVGPEFSCSCTADSSSFVAKSVANVRCFSRSSWFGRPQNFNDALALQRRVSCFGASSPAYRNPRVLPAALVAYKGGLSSICVVLSQSCLFVQLSGKLVNGAHERPETFRPKPSIL